MVWRQNRASRAWPRFRPRGRPVKVDFSQAMLVFVVLAPGVVFAFLALLWLLGWVPPERVVSGITGATFSAVHLALLRGSAEACGDRASGRNGDLRQLVRGARLSISHGADGGPAVPAFPRHDRGAVGTDRAVLGDIPSSRARLFPVLSAAASFCVWISARIRRRFVRPAGGGLGDSWASLLCC